MTGRSARPFLNGLHRSDEPEQPEPRAGLDEAWILRRIAESAPQRIHRRVQTAVEIHVKVRPKVRRQLPAPEVPGPGQQQMEDLKRFLL